MNSISQVSVKRKYPHNIAISQSFSAKNPYFLKSIIFIFLFASGTFSLKAQDLRFSQWHASETFVNPAFAGAYSQPRIILNFRDQWPNLPQTYVSYRAAYDGYINAISSGIGVYVYQDNQGEGVLQNTAMGFQYMYQARLSDNWALNFGLQFGFQQYRLNWNDLQFYDQIDLLYGFNDASGNPNLTTEAAPTNLTDGFFDMGGGLLLYSKNLYLGLSLGHLTKPSISFYGDNASVIPVSFSGQTGVFIQGAKMRNPLIVNPIAVYTNQAGFQQIETGLYVKKGIILSGLFFKHNTSNLSDVVICAGISKGLVKFAYSYDIATGDLAGLTGGGHELSLIVSFKENIGRTKKNSQKSMLDCPSVL